MKIVCAASVLLGREAFSTLGETIVLPDRAITSEHLRDADALVVRSKTDVNAELLDGTRVSFVGTATAGFDHFDTDYLDQAEIAWYAAAGCNANSVAEYVVAALLCLGRRHDLTLAGRTLGVIGVGQVGGRVVRKAEALGLRVFQNDPPRALAEGDSIFQPLETVLAEADILTLHVPLTDGGPFATRGMGNCRFFGRCQPGMLLLNSSRGEVIESDSLMFALEHETISRVVLDVWENEPNIRQDLLARADLATPHIAGYSFEGRLNGTLQVYRELCHFLEVEPTWEPAASALPPGSVITFDASGLEPEEVLWRAVRAAYDIEADDRVLRIGAVAEVGARFETLRKTYGVRREFSAATVRIAGLTSDVRQTLEALGFCLDSSV